MMSLLAAMGDEHHTAGYRSEIARVEFPTEAGGRERESCSPGVQEAKCDTYICFVVVQSQ